MRKVPTIDVWKALFLILFFTAVQLEKAGATTITFTSQPDWQAAVGGPVNVTVFHFDGPAELDGQFANDPLIDPSYSSLGVDFLPFRDTTVYPILSRGQGHQIPDPSRDGLLANSSSPNPLSDLIGRAIRFDFNIKTNAVGVFTNRWPLNDPVGDGGYLQAFDASQSMIGEVELGAGIFGGLITDDPIAHVIILNTWDSDIMYGIWDLQFAKTPVLTTVPGARPTDTRLYPNQPNPFNPKTVIRYDLPDAYRVTLRIYDVRGSLVSSLVDAELPRGSHQADWSGRDGQGRPMPSGTYFYCLKAGNYVETRRMVLIQ